MAYQTGTATDIIDLLDKLRAFALGLGWTIHRFDAGTDGWLALSHANAGYFNLRKRASYDHLETLGATGYDAGLAFTSQPGASLTPRTSELAGPYEAYHFYGSTQYLHVVIEIGAARYRHFHVGTLDKIGTWNGGEYVTGTFWTQTASEVDDPDSGYHLIPFEALASYTWISPTSQLRTDIDAQGSIWRDFYSGWANAGGTKAGGFMRGRTGYTYIPSINYWTATPNTFNGITPLLPSLICVGRDGDSSRLSPGGYVPDLRGINMRNLAPGAQVTIGADVWDCYPMARRTDTYQEGTDTENSWYYGYAYRRVT